jgi:hypothetical protein
VKALLRPVAAVAVLIAVASAALGAATGLEPATLKDLVTRLVDTKLAEATPTTLNAALKHHVKFQSPEFQTQAPRCFANAETDQAPTVPIKGLANFSSVLAGGTCGALRLTDMTLFLSGSDLSLPEQVVKLFTAELGIPTRTDVNDIGSTTLVWQRPAQIFIVVYDRSRADVKIDVVEHEVKP